MTAAFVLLTGGVVLGIVATSGNKDKMRAENKDPQGGGDNRDDKKTEDPPKLGQNQPFINEDFREASEKQRGLPPGWVGEALRVPKQKQGAEAWLAVGQPEGEYFVTLPRPLPLTGDFSLSGEYEMYSYHKLTIRLTGEKGTLEIGIDRRLPPSNYKYATHTPFRVMREGDTLRVWQYDELAVAKPLKELVDYDTIGIGMKAGSYAGISAKLYRLTAGPLLR